MDPLTKTEFVLSSLRDAIISGELQPGDWIRADQWAERLGLSETPIREAISRLEGLGLLEIYPHRGAQVKSRTREHVVETYIIRSALEAAAARYAIERSSERELQKLVARVDRLTDGMAQAVREGDVALVRRRNREIHMSIYEAARLPRLVALIKGLWAIYPFDTLEAIEGRPEASLEEHRAIADTLRSRDAELLAQAIGAHLASAQQLLRQMTIPGELGDRN